MVELVGRDGELAALRGVLESALAGHGGLAVVEGEAGIGKSRLVAEARAVALELGLQVVVAGADELQRTVPYAPLVAAFGCRPTSPDPDRARVAELLREAPMAAMPGVGPPDADPRLIEALCAIVEGLAAAGPTLLVLEDLHWADAASVAAFLTFARRFGDLPLVLLGSMRPEGDPGVARAGGTLVRLDPLTEAEARALIASLVGAPPGERLAAMVAGAAGNPLFITELVRALDDDGAITIAGGVAEIAEAELPPPLRQTILRGMSTLSEPSLEALRLASLLGTTFDAGDLAALLSLLPVELERRLRESFDRGVLVPAGELIAFRHDLVREAIYGDMPEALRRGMHRQVAEVLEAAGAPVTRVAEHLAIGAQPGDARAIQRLDEAWIEAAVVQDYETFAHLSAAAEALHEPDDPRRDLYIGLHIQERLLAGAVEEVEALLRAKLAEARPPLVEAMLRFQLALVYLGAGRAGDAAEQEALLVSVEGLPPKARLALLQQAGQAASTRGDWAAIDRYVAEVVPLAQREGDGFSVALLRFWQAYGRFSTGRLREAVALAESIPPVSPAMETSVRLNLVHFLAECDRLEEARALEAATDDRSSLFIAADMIERGAWDDAEVEFEAMHADDPGGLWGLGGLAAIAIRRGRFERAERLLQEAEPLAAPVPGRIGPAVDLLIAGRAELLEATGEPAKALAFLRERWEVVRDFRSPGVFRWLAPFAVRLGVEHGDRVSAERVEAEARAWAQAADGVPSADAMALVCRGVLAGDPDPIVRAVELVAATGERAFTQALWREHAGRALVAADRGDEARPHFDAALDAYESMGADHLAARTGAAMREAGFRRGVRGKRARAKAGWESLTPTEMKVVEHVTAGLRNAEVAARLFISPRTVGTHLQHVYGKLGITSRVELTKAYTERRALEPR